jgi:cytochrome b561
MEHRSPTRYGVVAQAFHWATAILLLVTFTYGPGGSEHRVYSQVRAFDRQVHETLGLCVLALVTMRVLWRLVDTRPESPQAARWMSAAATAMQGTLYLLLFALPLTAIAGAWLEGHPLTVLAGVEVPSILGVSHRAGVSIARIHTWLGDAVLWLAGIHALAALYHHAVLKDDVLISMLPQRLTPRLPRKD